ncbi:hypothetical protein [Aeromonas veronii]|uniref:hypothetical protein n=1 Tax=Aeromonas veronii TaxID=654 RepID=UPI0024418312|nr:hypothetical protein [Aeromonas veronii]
MTDGKRKPSQLAADERYEGKRAELPRFGGRCSKEEKELLARIAAGLGIAEKEAVFHALRFFDEHHQKDS